ncbi:hypothetical protein [Helicobacter bilis]|uniref:Uncharacterized protein n=2 Tax=Helicobacter bilis TaxID=37372 RepID=A0A6D2CAF2_9HELI|nr:hypothetical protein [Helicobacter bilis]EMZ39223.1 hypothetical protein C826_01199 [Helicobacter bilis WiWa]TLE03716.1 hypothetical protein LS77_008325 [Helicobacter bilis]TLE04588.1 hypothetical protein LS76_007965 [Helicobacter bilis]
MFIDNKKELAEAIQALAESLNANADYIEIEGDIGEDIARIKKLGSVFWGFGMTLISSVVEKIIKKDSMQVNDSMIVELERRLGREAINTAILLALSVNDVSILKKLKAYNLEKLDNKVILKKINDYFRVLLSNYITLSHFTKSI